jgi:prepilin-type N-terminal cleavage/methylation domain-containing protein
MVLLNTYKPSNGFTLVEVMVVIAIFALIVGFSLVIDFDSLRQDTLRSERNTLISVMARARSESMANTFSTAHGVCYLSGNYIIFRGYDCVASSTNETFEADIKIASLSNLTNNFPVIIFSQLTATASPVSIELSDGSKTTKIQINNEGMINWQ